MSRFPRALRLTLVAALTLALAPASAAAATPTTLEGEAIVEVAENPPVAGQNTGSEKVERTVVLMTPAGERVPLAWANGRTPDFVPGSKVRVKGNRGQGNGAAFTVADNGMTVLEAAAPSTIEASQEAAAPVTKKVLVLLVNFSTDKRQPWTASNVSNLFFGTSGSVKKFFSDASYGRLAVTGTVRGYFTISAGRSTCDRTTWASQARSKAMAAGINPGAYHHVVYAFPQQSSCWWAGFAQLPGRDSWINGYMTMHVASHELGHNFGFNHAGAYRCTNASGTRMQISTRCSLSEYGDPFDVMGNGTRYPQAFHRKQAGWLASGQMKTITVNGKYTLYPLTSGSAVPNVLRVRRADGTYLYIEYRRPMGFDSFASTHTAVRGALIRIAPDYTRSVTRLIDTTPATNTFDDAALLPGKSFLDNVGVRTVTVVSASTSSMVVYVAIGSASDKTAPSGVGSLAATITAPTTVKLTWKAATDNIEVAGYKIWRNGTYLGQIKPATSWSYSNLSAGSKYTWNVRAFDPAGNLGPSVYVTHYAPVKDTTAPSAVSSIAAKATGLTTATISWGAATDNVAVTGYKIYRFSTLVATVSGSARSWNATGLTSGSSYSWYVRAVDLWGNLGPSKGVSLRQPVPDTTKPSMPSGLTATAKSSTAVELRWSASTDNVGVAGYRVYRDGVLVSTRAADSLNYWNSSLITGRTYTWTVTAFDKAGNVSPAAKVVLKVPDLTAPSTPGSFVAKSTAAGSVTLSWSASTDNVAVTGYVLTRDDQPVATLPATVRTYTEVNLPQGATHAWRVVAIDAAGNQSDRAKLYFTVPDVTAPSAVGSLTVAARDYSTAARLTWTHASDNVALGGYRIWRDGVLLTTLSAWTTSWTEYGLTHSVPYRWLVVPFDKAGNLGPETTAELTMPYVDRTAPSAPTNLVGSVGANRQITLTWEASTDDVAVIGYRIYRDGKYRETITETTYVSSSSPGTRSWYVIAEDAAGNRSERSNTINLTVK